MKLLSDLLKSLAIKAGVDPEKDATFKKILADENVTHFELDDEFANPLEQNLLTEQSAVVNGNVKSKLFAQALNGVEHELQQILDTAGFSDDFKAAYKAIEKNTNERVRKLNEGLKAQIKAIKDSKPTDNDSKLQIKALENQITELNNAAAAANKVHATELDNMKISNLNEKKGYLMSSILGGKPLPKNGLNPSINIKLARTLLEEDMAKKNLLVVFDESGNPVLKEKKGGAESPYYVNNHLINLDSYVDGVLAQNNFVQLNDDQNGGQNGSDKNQFSQEQRNGGNGQLKNNEAANEAMNKVKQALNMNGVGTTV